MKQNPGLVMKEVECKLCFSKKNCFFLRGKDFQHGIGDNFVLVKCKNCGLVYTNPRIASKDLEKIYPENYVPYQEFKKKQKNYLKFFIQKSVLANYYNYPFKKSFLVKFLFFPFYLFQKIKKSKVLPFIGKGRLLEIGAGNGANLFFLKSLGWRVTGIEFSGKAAETAKKNGLNIVVGRAENVSLNQKFDLVLMIYLFEHLGDPAKVLRKTKKWLAKNGLLVIDVPNIDSIEFKVFKEKWFPLELPRHFYHFSPKTITLMLEKHGFKVIKIQHDPSPKRFLQSINYVFNTKGLENKKFLRLLVFPFTYFFALIGKSATMRVIAQVK